jgi:hypothetical protein
MVSNKPRSSSLSKKEALAKTLFAQGLWNMRERKTGGSQAAFLAAAPLEQTLCVPGHYEHRA